MSHKGDMEDTVNIHPKYNLEWLRDRYRDGSCPELHLFFGSQASRDGQVASGCLSQWWMADFTSDGQTYCCTEQFMMAGKARLFGDQEILERILSSVSPRDIKALGRRVRGFDSRHWDEHKYAIVLEGNLRKFEQNARLRKFLLSTGDRVLAEASPYDGIWGIRLATQDPDARNPLKWRGQNLLGFALMEVRDILRTT